MTKLTQATAVAIATAASQVRADWDHPGILHALRIEADKGTSAEDVFVALAHICRRTDVRSPGFLNQPGPHWTRDDGQAVTRRGDHNVPCPDHPTEHDMPCPNPPEPIDPTVQASLAAQARAGIAQGLERLHSRPMPGRVPPPGVTPKESHHVD